MIADMELPHLTYEDRCRVACIADSYQRLTGGALVASTGEAIDACVAALWNAPCAIVAHGTEDDPIFFFGNRTALALFEMDFDAFTHLPSRFSAEPMAREERVRFLERVGRDGIVDDYKGVRISSTGRRFLISNASVWNLANAQGAAVGQAAALFEWTHIAR